MQARTGTSYFVWAIELPPTTVRMNHERLPPALRLSCYIVDDVTRPNMNTSTASISFVALIIVFMNITIFLFCFILYKVQDLTFDI
jgi:hypothetical protein